MFSLSLLTGLFQCIHSSIQTWLMHGLLAILATGPVPRHISFEMDGNRRYARKWGKEGKEGHSVGFENMFSALELCAQLGIQCVTVYAFSIENFNRPRDEVETIMDLFVKISEYGDFFDRHGVRVNFLGRRELFPPTVQEAVAKAERITRHHSTVIFNVCAPYASQDEIATAVERVIQKAIESGNLDGSTLTEDAIHSHLSTSLVGSPPLDIFVRTSGVTRLSGFLTWQVHIVDTFWPEFGLFDLVPIMLEYQRKVWAEENKRPFGVFSMRWV